MCDCLIVLCDMLSEKKKEIDKTKQSEIKAKKVSKTVVQLLKKLFACVYLDKNDREILKLPLVVVSATTTVRKFRVISVERNFVPQRACL